MGKPLKVRSDSVVKIAGKIARDDKGHGQEEKGRKKSGRKGEKSLDALFMDYGGRQRDCQFCAGCPVVRYTRPKHPLFFPSYNTFPSLIPKHA